MEFHILIFNKKMYVGSKFNWNLIYYLLNVYINTDLKFTLKLITEMD